MVLESDISAKRYKRTKLRIYPITKIEKMKSSLSNSKLGLDAISRIKHDVVPTKFFHQYFEHGG